MGARKVIKRFPLSEPVTDFDGEEVAEIVLHKASGKDLRRAGAASNDTDMSLRLLSSMSGVSDSVVDDMSLDDLMPILEYIGRECLGKPAGSEPSPNGATSSERSPTSTAGPRPS